MAGSEPFENPLVPNARLRQMLLAMHRARAVEQHVPLRRRAGVTGLEACLIAPAIDLGPEDLLSDTLHGPALDFLRGVPLQTAFDPASRSRKRPVLADAGSGRPLPWSGRPEDRLWIALGAAAALRASRQAGEAEGPAAQPPGALVSYLRAGEITPAVLGRAFQFSFEHRLPILFVALPASLKDNGGGVSAMGRLASRSGMPAMAADRSDAVAIYRVAQESLGRARSGGGPALIECVPFVLHGTKPAGQTADPLTVIERYTLERKIITPEWIARETRIFARQLPDPLH